MIYNLKTFVTIFFFALVLQACNQAPESTEEKVEIERMDSTTKTVEKNTDELEDQTKKVEEALEKLENQFDSTKN
jgi:septal ring factor EnvC (AmiA/AmiB activator)